ncbi:MAG: hypothetical protein HN348_24335, partial [Proteobacteria bacterium]|nr:hypothetical protein [Pseudomonadota bacterium]
GERFTVEDLGMEHSDILEGFAIPTWNWIVVSPTAGAEFPRTRGRVDWLPDVLAHEFAHIVSLKKARTFSEVINLRVDVGVYADTSPYEEGLQVSLADPFPYWWVEGGAEYWSEQVGYNFWGSSREMHLRSSVLEDRLLTWDEWLVARDKTDWGDGERAYLQGYSFGRYLGDRFGTDVYAQMAEIAGKRFRLDFEPLLRKATGVKGRELFGDWREHQTGKYEQQKVELVQSGIVEGEEIVMATQPWQRKSLRAQDDWESKKKGNREDARERTGRWDLFPRYSHDGRFFAENRGGWLRVSFADETLWPGINGEHPSAPQARLKRLEAAEAVYLPMSRARGFDFVPGRDAIVLCASEHVGDSQLRVEGDGLDWSQLFIVDLTPKEKKRRHRAKWEQYPSLDFGYGARARYEAIPNTLRGVEPSVSPDGDLVAFLQYHNGAMNVVTTGLRGENRRQLTHFDGNAHLQGVDWSPDGSTLVVSLLKNDQQDLWLLKVEDEQMTPLTWTRWEEQDPHWATDGWIYFSADVEGVFDIFRLEPQSGAVQRITRVLGGAVTPWLTPQEHLLYSQHTAHGWKSFALARDEFSTVDVSHHFPQPPLIQAREFLQYEETWPLLESRPYRLTNSLMPPGVSPMFRFEFGQNNTGILVGGYLKLKDYSQRHVASATVLLGTDLLLSGRYEFRGLWPEFSLQAWHFDGRDYSKTAFAGRQRQRIDLGSLTITLPYNDDIAIFGRATIMETASRRSVETSMYKDFRSARFEAGLRLGDDESLDKIHPRGKGALFFAYGRGQSAYLRGSAVDDGEVLTNYGYNRLHFSGEYWAPFAGRGHAVQMSLVGGYIDKN